MAMLHFVLQQFNAVIDCCEEGGNLGGYTERLSTVCRKLVVLKPDDQVQLRNDQLALLFTDQLGVYKQFSYYTYFHAMQNQPRPNLYTYVTLASAMLQEMNEPRRWEIQMLDLDARADGFYLDVSGRPFSRYRLMIPGYYYKNVLWPYDFRELNISNTPLVDLSELSDLNVDVLVMKNMDFLRYPNRTRFVNALKAMKVRKLVVSSGAFPPKFMKRLESVCEVVEQ